MDITHANQSVDSPSNPTKNSIPNHLIRNQRGSTPIILGVFVLLFVVAAGAYYLGTQRTSSKISMVTSPSPGASQQAPVVTSPTPIPVTIETLKDWKTYTNTSQQYSVKYPSDWTVEPLESGNRLHFRKVYPELGPHIDHSIYVTIQENKEGLSLPDWVTKQVVDPAASNYKKQNVDNTIARETVTKEGRTIEMVTGAHLPAANDSIHAYFIEGTMVVEMALMPYNAGQFETDFDKKGKEILANMLTTFQSKK